MLWVMGDRNCSSASPYVIGVRWVEARRDERRLSTEHLCATKLWPSSMESRIIEPSLKSDRVFAPKMPGLISLVKTSLNPRPSDCVCKKMNFDHVRQKHEAKYSKVRSTFCLEKRLPSTIVVIHLPVILGSRVYPEHSVVMGLQWSWAHYVRTLLGRYSSALLHRSCQLRDHTSERSSNHDRPQRLGSIIV